MSSLASTLINWTALWKIGAAALIGGGGVVIAFGLAVVGLERARRSQSAGPRVALRALAVACGLFCIAAVALGIYAMAKKPAAKTVPKRAGATLSTPRTART